MNATRLLSPDQPILPRGRFKDPVAVEAILAGIDLSTEILNAAAHGGLQEYLECTRHDPRHLPSVMLSGKTARGLSDLLVPQPHRWRHRDRMGQTAVVHPWDLVAVTVAIGDAKTGLVTKTPSTSAAKGLAAEALIQDTQRRLWSSSCEISDAPIGCVFLLHVFDNEQVMNLEFSVPERLDEDRKISAWRTRLILPQIPFGRITGQPADVPKPAPQQPVGVQRKSA